MKKYILFFIIFLFVCFYNANSQNLLCGKVFNQKGEALYPANIRLKNPKTVTSTDNEGSFCLKTSKRAEITISFIGYETKDLTIVFTPNTKDSVIAIVLNEQQIQLNPVDITSEKIELITKEKLIWITDYEFWNDDIFTLNINDNIRKLSLITKKDIITWEKELKGGMRSCKHLYKDYQSNIFLLSDDSAYQITNRNERIYFFDGVSIKDFKNLIVPSLGKCDDYIIYRQYGAYNKSVFYYLINKSDKKLIFQQKDKIGEQYCNDKPIEKRLHYSPVVPLKHKKEWGSGDNSSNSGLDINKLFIDNIMSQPIEVHLFKIEDKIYIFDHYGNKMYVLYCNGEKIMVQSISYSKREDVVSKQLLLAENKKDVYALFLKDGLYSVQQIDLNTGQLKGNVIKFNQVFVEKITISDDAIYFLYKQNKENGRNLLYRMNY